jgi:hypothetical protein
MSDNGETIGYRYHSPAMEQGNLVSVEVVETSAMIEHSHVKSHRAAVVNQRVIRNALADRFSGTVSLQDIEKTANPDDGDAVQRTRHNLITAKLYQGLEGAPTYLTANGIIPTDMDPISIAIGIAKLKYADGRPRWQRMFGRGSAANLADMGDVYVDLSLVRRSGGPKRRGVGTAMLRTMLDHCPADMPTIVYEFPKLEGGLPTKLEENGFRANGSRIVEFCGVETEQVQYRGPLCGDLIEAIEAEQPWLTEREPITASRLTRG